MVNKRFRAAVLALLVLGLGATAITVGIKRSASSHAYRPVPPGAAITPAAALPGGALAPMAMEMASAHESRHVEAPVTQAFHARSSFDGHVAAGGTPHAPAIDDNTLLASNENLDAMMTPAYGMPGLGGGAGEPIAGPGDNAGPGASDGQGAGPSFSNGGGSLGGALPSGKGSGGKTSGGTTSGGNTPGGTTSGGNTSGGTTSGGDTPSGGTTGDGTSTTTTPTNGDGSTSTVADSGGPGDTTVSAVPEPSMMAMMALGSLSLVAFSRRKRARR